MRRAEGGAKMFGVFRVKNHDFTPKNHIFSNFRGGGGARAGCAPLWIRPWLIPFSPQRDAILCKFMTPKIIWRTDNKSPREHRGTIICKNTKLKTLSNTEPLKTGDDTRVQRHKYFRDTLLTIYLQVSTYYIDISRHKITKLLLKVALNTINLTPI